MHPSIHFSRRQWLKSAGAAFAGLALARRISRCAEPAQVGAAGSERSEPVQLSLNENPFGPSPRALAAMQREVPRVHRYPFKLTPGLVRKIAAKEGVPENHILLGVGSGEILETFGVYLGREHGEVITVSPGYMQMTGAMARMGTRVVAVPLNARLEHDLDAIAAKITPQTKAI
jgi:histidinol-phosphate aminotransferase